MESAEQGRQQKVAANGNALPTIKVKQEVLAVKSLSIEELGTQNYIGIGERDDSPEPVPAADRVNGGGFSQFKAILFLLYNSGVQLITGARRMEMTRPVMTKATRKSTT